MLSNNFNRFYHGVVLKQVGGLKEIKTDIEYLGRKFIFSPKRLNMDSLKQLLKAINLQYPRDSKGIPVSTRKIDSVELMQHIEYIIELCGNNGDILPFVADEWERIKMEAGII